MKKVRNGLNRGYVPKARVTIAICLFVSGAVLGLVATNQAQMQNCTPPPAGMVSWWPADGNANDIKGSNNGALQNGATFAPGMVGKAFSFDGIDDYLQTPDTGLPFGNAARTLDFWMQPGFDARVPVIYGNFAPSDAFYVLINGSNACIGQWGGGPPGEPCGSTDVTDGNWHHVAMTYDGASSVLLYVDGVLEASVTKIYATTQTGKLYMGSTVEGSQEYYAGLVDEVEIFNRALSQTEIQAIYNAGSAGKCITCTPPPPNMVSWWPGDGNASDIQGGNNATLQNGATFGAGMVDQAFLLDGIDDSVDVGIAPNLNVSSGEFTVDVWVNFNALSHPPGANEPGVPEGDMSIVDKMSPSGVNTDGWRLIKQDDNRFWFCFGAGGDNGCGDPGFTVFSQTQAVTGAYFHVSAVKTSTTFSIYVNGALEDTRALPSFTDSNSANLLIGANALEGAHLNGLVDEVEIFNRALSQSEIAGIVKAGSAGKCKTPPYSAKIQQPINADGSSDFSAKRGVVPVKFTLSQGEVATCNLPPATIAVTRTAGASTGTVNESVYSMAADSGSNFKITSCQYSYNLAGSSLGAGTYRVDIKINGTVVGSATFKLN